MKEGYIVWGLTPCGHDASTAYTPIQFYPHEVNGVYDRNASYNRMQKELAEKPVSYKSPGGFRGFHWEIANVELLCSDVLYVTEGFINK